MARIFRAALRSDGRIFGRCDRQGWRGSWDGQARGVVKRDVRRQPRRQAVFSARRAAGRQGVAERGGYRLPGWGVRASQRPMVGRSQCSWGPSAAVGSSPGQALAAVELLRPELFSLCQAELRPELGKHVPRQTSGLVALRTQVAPGHVRRALSVARTYYNVVGSGWAVVAFRPGLAGMDMLLLGPDEALAGAGHDDILAFLRETASRSPVQPARGKARRHAQAQRPTKIPGQGNLPTAKLARCQP